MVRTVCCLLGDLSIRAFPLLRIYDLKSIKHSQSEVLASVWVLQVFISREKKEKDQTNSDPQQQMSRMDETLKSKKWSRKTSGTEGEIDDHRCVYLYSRAKVSNGKE